jgi:hypothetical protein
MPTKYISTYYSHGYSLLPGVDLVITSTGTVAYDGVHSKYGGSITNEGVISSQSRFADGGVFLYDGGSVTNGTDSDFQASITGRTGVTVISGFGFVTNVGAIRGTDSNYGFGDGVDLEAGGRVVNSNAPKSPFDGAIEGDAGVSVKGGLGGVYNSGYIMGASKPGVALYAGGTVLNGYDGHIQGQDGVSVQDAAGSVDNSGSIVGQVSSGRGVFLGYGGSVKNDDTGVIEGGDGVFASGAAAYVGNTGYILAQDVSGTGVFLGHGGTLINGSGKYGYRASINGASGVMIEGAAPGTVINSGTIQATGDAFGVALLSGGTLANGSAKYAGALIEGSDGAYLYLGAKGSNFGTILGQGAAGEGVHLGNGTSFTNGSAGHRAALIEGYVGVDAYYQGAVTLTNFGTIIGTGKTAVDFAAATDVLGVGAGSAFEGAVLGAGGTLDLRSGTGKIAGLFASGGDVTVSGSMAQTTFQDFATLVVSAGATFTDSGAVTVAAGQTVNDAGVLDLDATARNTSAGLIETAGKGMLTIAGLLVNTGALAADGGTLAVSGGVTGAGVATIDGGTLDLKSSFNEAVAFTGATGVLELARSKTYAATITGFSTNGKTSLDLDDIGFVGSKEATFSGTKEGGVLTVSDGKHTAHINLEGDYANATFTASSDGHGGTDVVASKAERNTIPPLGLIASPHQFTEAMAGFGASAVAGSVHTSQSWSPRELAITGPRVAVA